MCGICGTIGLADERVVEAMTVALRHRGPDDDGAFVDEAAGIAFGHRRLSIIDLSAAGRQPMSYSGGRYWITYNGEIYNYRELRRELAGLGCEFRTHTDTEVILAAYAEWGSACLERFRGMFAFAVADLARREVLLARDRFGIKPLIYCQRSGGVLFASELNALLASERIARHLDVQALWDYLSLGSVAAPRTILCGVRRLEPGSAMLVAGDGTVKRHWRWWDLVGASAARADEVAGWTFEEAAAQLRERLEEATRCQLLADVPVGAFLSGGVDSAAMVGLMSRHATEPVRTFTVGFESHHDDLSETDQARETARHFRTIHEDVTITDTEAAASFDDLLRAWDQPSLDGANTFFVSRAAAEHVKVVFSGLGGDELFAGYPHFGRHAAAAQIRRFLGPLVTPLRCLPDRFRHNLMLPALEGPERLATLRCLMSEAGKGGAVHPSLLHDVSPESLERLYRCERYEKLDPLSALSAAELEGYMSRTLLQDGDVMSMAHGLELRPMLLDHLLAEFCFALPARFKLRSGRGKAIFHAALHDILPEFVIKRPKKGFELPLLRWLSGPLLERAEAAFASDIARHVFQERFLRSSQDHLRSPHPRDVRLWGYFVLLEWLSSRGIHP